MSNFTKESPSEESKEIIKGITSIGNGINVVFQKVGTFKLLDECLVPEGIKPIARSMSWLVEQIVIQNLRKYKTECCFADVINPPNSLVQYDCIIKLPNDPRDYFVNIKASLTTTKAGTKSDISKADKLIQLYNANPNMVLLVAIVKIRIEGIHITFNDVVMFNVAWTPDIYYNRANHNLQSGYIGQIIRSNEEFISLLKEKMRGAGHSEHY